MVHKLSLIASLLHGRNLLDGWGGLRGAPGGRGALGASAALEQQHQQQLLLLRGLLVLAQTLQQLREFRRGGCLFRFGNFREFFLKII